MLLFYEYSTKLITTRFFYEFLVKSVDNNNFLIAKMILCLKYIYVESNLLALHLFMQKGTFKYYEWQYLCNL